MYIDWLSVVLGVIMIVCGYICITNSQSDAVHRASFVLMAIGCIGILIAVGAIPLSFLQHAGNSTSTTPTNSTSTVSST